MRAVRPTRTRLTGAVAVLALGTVLTACGSDDPESAQDQQPAATDSSATSEATEDPSGEESGATDPAPAVDPSVIDDGAQIAVDQFARRLQAGIEKTKQAHIEFTMGGTGGEIQGSGDVDYTAKPPNMQMSMAIGPQSVGMLVVDGLMYVQSSQAGDKYLKYDLSDPHNPLGAGVADQLDPAGSVEAFAEALSSVTASGEEKVDGQTLERFVLTIDTSKLADQASAASLPPEMEIIVWLDDQDRMAKTSMAMGALQYDATLSDFDKAVELEAPPANQVVEPPGS